ncbi:MAG: hypothetical protein VX278_06975 [Myxococcota bacterium]|nr:hypothetical protein [Myxococcota bacterium]
MPRVRNQTVLFHHRQLSESATNWPQLKEAGSLLFYTYIHGISHLLIGGQKADAIRLIQNYKWLLKRIQYNEIKNQVELEKNYWLLSMISKDKTVQEWNDFVQKNIRLFFSQSDNKDRMLHQLAHDYAKESHIGAAAAEWYDEQDEEWFWLAKQNRPAKPELSECIHTIIDHTGNITDFLRISDKTVLYWAKQHRSERYQLILYNLYNKEVETLIASEKPSVFWKQLDARYVFIQFSDHNHLLDLQTKQQMELKLPILRSKDDIWQGSDGRWKVIHSVLREHQGHTDTFHDIYTLDLASKEVSHLLKEEDIDWSTTTRKRRNPIWKQVHNDIFLVALPMLRLRWCKHDTKWEEGALLERAENLFAFPKRGLAYIDDTCIRCLTKPRLGSATPETILTMPSDIISAHPLNEHEMVLTTKRVLLHKLGQDVSQFCIAGSVYCTWSKDQSLLQLWDQHGAMIWQRKHPKEEVAFADDEQPVQCSVLVYADKSIYFYHAENHKIWIYTEDGQEIDRIDSAVFFQSFESQNFWVIREKDTHTLWRQHAGKATRICSIDGHRAQIHQEPQASVIVLYNQGAQHILLLSEETYFHNTLPGNAPNQVLFSEKFVVCYDKETHTLYRITETECFASNAPDIIRHLAQEDALSIVHQHNDLIFIPMDSAKDGSDQSILVWHTTQNKCAIMPVGGFFDFDERFLFRRTPHPATSSHVEIRNGKLYIYSGVADAVSTWFADLHKDERRPLPISLVLDNRGGIPSKVRRTREMEHLCELVKERFFDTETNRAQPMPSDPRRRRRRPSSRMRRRSMRRYDRDWEPKEPTPQRRKAHFFNKGMLYEMDGQYHFWYPNEPAWKPDLDLNPDHCLAISDDCILAWESTTKWLFYVVDWNPQEDTVHTHASTIFEPAEKPDKNQRTRIHPLRKIEIGSQTYFLPVEKLRVLKDQSVFIVDKHYQFFHHWCDGELRWIKRPYDSSGEERKWKHHAYEGVEFEDWLLFTQRDGDSEEDTPLLWNWRTDERLPFPADVERSHLFHGAFGVAEDRLFLWFENMLFLWKPWEGSVESVPLPHLGRIIHVLQHANGQYLSLGWDEDLFMWDLKGNVKRIGLGANILWVYQSKTKTVATTSPKKKLYSRFKNYEKKAYCIEDNGELSSCTPSDYPETYRSLYLRTGQHTVQHLTVKIDAEEQMMIYDPRVSSEPQSVQEVYQRPNQPQKWFRPNQVSWKETIDTENDHYQFCASVSYNRAAIINVAKRTIQTIDGHLLPAHLEDLLVEVSQNMPLYKEISLLGVKKESVLGFRDQRLIAQQDRGTFKPKDTNVVYGDETWYDMEEFTEFRFFDVSTQAVQLCLQTEKLSPEKAFIHKDKLFATVVANRRKEFFGCHILNETYVLGRDANTFASNRAIDISGDHTFIKEIQTVYSPEGKPIASLMLPPKPEHIQKSSDNLLCVSEDELHIFNEIPKGYFADHSVWNSEEHQKGSFLETEGNISRCTLFEGTINTLSQSGVIRIWDPSRIRPQSSKENILGARLLPGDDIISWQESTTIFYTRDAEVSSIENIPRKLYGIRNGYLLFEDGSVLKHGQELSYMIDDGSSEFTMLLIRYLSKHQPNHLQYDELLELYQQPNPLHPSKILDAKTPEDWLVVLNQVCQSAHSGIMLSKIISALFRYLISPRYTKGVNHKENMCRFLLFPGIHADIRFLFHRVVSNSGIKAVKELLRDPRIAIMVLDYLDMKIIDKKQNTTVNPKQIRFEGEEIYSSPTPWSKRKVLGVSHNRIILAPIDEDVHEKDTGDQYFVSASQSLYRTRGSITMMDEKQNKELWTRKIDAGHLYVVSADRIVVFARTVRTHQLLLLDAHSGETLREMSPLPIPGPKRFLGVSAHAEESYLLWMPAGEGIQCYRWKSKENTLEEMSPRDIFSSYPETHRLSFSPLQQGLFHLTHRDGETHIMAAELDKSMVSWFSGGEWLAHELSINGKCLLSKGDRIAVLQLMRGKEAVSLEQFTAHTKAVEKEMS